MSITLYELASNDPERRFSPFCWRIRLALEHKGLDYDAVEVGFMEKERLKFSGQDKVPVLVDGDSVISDSWEIAAYLERAYPDRPSLFGGQEGLSLSRFFVDWTDTILHPALVRLLVADQFGQLREEDKPYFRESRETRFGVTLEEFCKDSENRTKILRQELTPLRRMLGQQPYIGGNTPLMADYTVMGAFMWARSVGKTPLLAEDDPVLQWRNRIIGRLGPMSAKLKAHY